MTLWPNRTCYVPSGRFDAARLAVVLAAIIATACGVALAFEGMLLAGFYFSGLATMLPMTLASACVGWGVRYCHCRNRVLAAALGFACGLCAYLAYFHVDQCVRWGAPAPAVDRLPEYIAFRLQTDAWRRGQRGEVLEPLRPQPNVQPQAPLGAVNPLTFNFGLFLFDAAVMSLVPATTGIGLARRPYSEKQRRWCSRESILVTKRVGAALPRWLASGDASPWADSDPPRAAAHEPHCKLTVWYAPWDREKGLDCDVFLSIDKGPCLRLSSAEAAAFMNLLPDMQDIVGPAIASDREYEADADSSVARMWPVPAPYAGPAHSRLKRELLRLRRRLLIFGPYLLGIAFLVGGTWFIGEWLVKPGFVPSWVSAVYVAGLGFPLAFVGKSRLRPERCWELDLGDARRLVLETIARRPDPLVKADDPEAIYVELAPRRCWQTGDLPRRHETNEGLMKFSDVILFEGENHRISLPAESILCARIEGLLGVPQTIEGMYAVVLRVRLDSTVRDLPFFPLGGLGVQGNCVTTLFALFEEYCGRDLGQMPSQPPPPVEIPIPA
jgi:hypothetical protein